MADMLTLGQQHLTVLHYEAQQRSVALPSNKLFQIRTAKLGSALKQGKESWLSLLSLLCQSGMSAPFALGHNLYSRCLLDQWIFQLGQVTQLLGAGLGFSQGLNPQHSKQYLI